jgi:predicted SnoaL-like aldol condensation-catalyzing enzyme
MTMDIETNKAIVRRYIELWNTGNVALADEVLAPDYKDYAHPEATGPERVKQSVLAVRAADPQFHISIDLMMGEGDMIALQATIRSTRQGKEVLSRVAWFARVEGGKMAEWWTWYERNS